MTVSPESGCLCAQKGGYDLRAAPYEWERTSIDSSSWRAVCLTALKLTSASMPHSTHQVGAGITRRGALLTPRGHLTAQAIDPSTRRPQAGGTRCIADQHILRCHHQIA